MRWAKRKGVPKGSWLGRMLERKAPMLVIVALANKNTRIVWALLTKGEAIGLRSCPLERHGREAVGVKGQVWRKVGEAGSGEPGAWGALRARSSDVDLILELPIRARGHDEP